MSNSNNKNIGFDFNSSGFASNSRSSKTTVQTINKGTSPQLFRSICSHFLSSFDGDKSKSAEVLHIKRVVNVESLKWYEAMERRVGSEIPINSKFVYHGTSAENAKNIIKSAIYNRSYTKRWKYGQGVYFSPFSSISAGYAPSDSNGVQTLLLSKVIMGRSEIGTSKKVISHGYHSMVDDIQNPKIICVPLDGHSYPMYEIQFKLRDIKQQQIQKVFKKINSTPKKQAIIRPIHHNMASIQSLSVKRANTNSIATINKGGFRTTSVNSRYTGNHHVPTLIPINKNGITQQNPTNSQIKPTKPISNTKPISYTKPKRKRSAISGSNQTGITQPPLKRVKRTNSNRSGEDITWRRKNGVIICKPCYDKTGRFIIYGTGYACNVHCKKDHPETYKKI